MSMLPLCLRGILRPFTYTNLFPRHLLTRRTLYAQSTARQRFQIQSFPTVARQGSNGQGRRQPPYRLLAVMFSAGGVYYVAHLERTETGRLRFIDVSEVTEAEMGKQAAQQVFDQYRGRFLSPSDSRVRQVTRVVERLLTASNVASPDQIKGQGHPQDSHASEADWRVFVIDDPQTANAFVLPNGNIFVFTGILPVAGNEDGLAAVLGHEMAHKLARHGGERLSGAKVTQFLLFALSTLGLDPGLSSGAVQLLMELPNSRSNESEADQIGLRLAAQACYDPREAVHLWERMREQHGGTGGLASMLSTHPTDDRRIKDIQKWLPNALQIAADKCNMSEFRALANAAS